MSRRRRERAAQPVKPATRPDWTSGPRPYLLAVAIFAVVAALAYAHVLRGPFVFDDLNIVSSRLVRIQNLGQLDALFAARGIPRKIGMATFALNHIVGGFDSFGYHLVNVILHVLNGLLLFHVSRRLIRALPGHPWRERATLIALLGATLWLAHPIHTQAVSYIWQRFTVLGATFFLGSLACYLEARLRPSPWLFAPAGALYLLALGTKENTAVLPLMLLLLELLVLRHAQGLSRRRLLLGAAAGLVAFAAVAAYFLGPNALRQMRATAEHRGFTLTERLMTQPRVIGHYVSLLALPLPSHMNLDYDFPKSTSLTNPPTTALALAALVAAVALALQQWRRRPLLSFAILWFLGNLAIESSIVPLDMVYEHRLYLPTTIPMVFACGWLLTLRWQTRHAVVTLAALTLALTLTSSARNRVWADELALWKDNAAKSPGKARAWGNLGKAYQERGQFDEARAAFERALELDPKQVRALNNLALIYLNQLGEPRKARQLLERALALDPEDAPTHVNLGVACNQTDDPTAALKHFQIAFDADPDAPQSFHNLAVAHYRLKQYDRAVEVLERGIALFPEEPSLRGLLGMVYRDMGDEARSREALRWAAMLDARRADSSRR
jgi:tetratricopeptide (TPR) repeat protein